MAGKRVGRYPRLFREMALERMKNCDNITALAKELRIDRKLLYIWRDQLQPVDVGTVDDGNWPRANTGDRDLRKEVTQLKRLLADKVLELDFFKGALQKIEARRRSCGGSGVKASTTKSGK